MEENYLNIKINENLDIYGILDKADEKNTKCIILVHGFASNVRDWLFQASTYQFNQLGYDVLRISLYDWSPKTRDMIDCTLETYANDLTLFIDETTKEYQNIFICGHSYGGATVALCNHPSITAASLWEPSFNLKRLWDDYLTSEDIGKNYRVSTAGSGYITGEVIVQESQSQGEGYCRKLGRNLKFPTQCIFAGIYPVYAKAPYSYDSDCTKQTERHTLETSTHGFVEKGAVDDLVKLSHAWFQRFLRTKKASK